MSSTLQYKISSSRSPSFSRFYFFPPQLNFLALSLFPFLPDSYLYLSKFCVASQLSRLRQNFFCPYL
ncbi:hypothetical protein E2C01_051950 [Portunus trituberculatus]|uniref:Uncharacterized protein n=1 Tax=Portunus trituberculatus TaxID=210409 RepID=A0A5B7GLS6_PORTR|nr:hypothetical protein [Portunus trituberculatus]